MEDICKTLLNTYNTNVLDGLDTHLQQALKREAECSEQNPNPSGKDREILRKLIKNHYDESKIKPSAKFIGGPKTLTVHYLPEYQKNIYIFGEQHINMMDCKKFDNFLEKEDLITPIEEYLYKLITNTDVFIDIFAELHTYDKSGEYPKDYIPYADMNGRIANLFKNFKKCLQKNTRHDEDCKLARIHYIDIRNESGFEYENPKVYDIFWYSEEMKSIIDNDIMHNNILEKIDKIKQEEEPGYLYHFFYNYEFINKEDKTEEQISDELRLLWNNLTVESKKVWVEKQADRRTAGSKMRTLIEESSTIKYIFDKLSNTNEEVYKKYWIIQITLNKFIMKEKKRPFINPNVKQYIIDFINTEIDTIVMKDREKWKEYVHTIREIINEPYSNRIKRIVDDDRLYYFIKRTLDYFLYPHAILVDYYSLLRIFKVFNMTDMEKAYTGATDQPSTANNIIIYAGDYHSDRYRRFLKSIGNDPIEKTGNFLEDTTLPQNCINMSDIRQPFFNF
jgi:hypothetical protein